MKKYIFVIFFIFNSSVNAGIQEDINAAMSDVQYDYSLLSKWLSEQLSEGTAFLAASGANIPAHIPGFPGFEIGVGGMVGLWDTEIDKLRALPTKTLKTDKIDMEEKFGLPGWVAHAKISIPFGIDIGPKLGGLNVSKTVDKTTFKIKNSLFGIELRKQLLGKGLTGVVLPDVTAVLSFDTAKGEISISQDYIDTTPENYSDISYTQTIDAKTTWKTEWNTKALTAKVVVSKSFLIITPFAGLGITKNSGKVDSSISTIGSLRLVGDGNDQIAQLNAVGKGDDDATATDIRILAGFDLNILLLKINLSIETAGKKTAGSVGVRLQF